MDCSRVLALDTSTQSCSVAVALDGVICAEESSSFAFRHNEDISVTVQTALESSGLSMDSITAIIVGSGPGSFTGLRIGYSFAMGMSAPHQIPVFQISSFLAAAIECPQGDLRIVTADARRNEYFVGAFSVYGDGNCKVEFSPEVLSAERLDTKVRDLASHLGISREGLVFAGLGEAAYFSEEHKSFASGTLVKGLVHAARKISQGKVVGFQSPTSHGWVSQMCSLQPNYVRAVFARTIQQREVDNSTPIA